MPDAYFEHNSYNRKLIVAPAPPLRHAFLRSCTRDCLCVRMAHRARAKAGRGQHSVAFLRGMFTWALASVPAKKSRAFVPATQNAKQVAHRVEELPPGIVAMACVRQLPGIGSGRRRSEGLAKA